MTSQTATFEINGKTYRTDAETVKVLRGIVPGAKASGDASAVTAVMGLGLKTGRIVEAPTCEHCGGPLNDAGYCNDDCTDEGGLLLRPIYHSLS